MPGPKPSHERRQDLVRGPVGPALIRLAWPMLLGISAIVLFQVVDTFWVGQLGTRELAAMAFTMPVAFVVSGIAMGMGIGVTAVVARATGAGDQERVRRLTTHSLVLAVVVVTAVATTGMSVIDPLFTVLGASSDLLPLIHAYMLPWFAGVGLLVLPMVGNGAMRGTGDTRTPSFVMLGAAFANMVLDPVLIFGVGPIPAFGLVGAALATVASWATAFALAFWILDRRKRLLLWAMPSASELATSWRAVLHVAVPAAMTQLLIPIGAGIMTRIVATHGAHAVAAFGVGARIESLSMIGVLALGSALGPFAGQNYGAGAGHRVRKATSLAIRTSLVWGAGAALLLGVLARPLAGLFADEVEVVETLAAYLMIVPLSYGMMGIVIVVNSVFNATNRPLVSTGLSALRLLVFGVPLALIGSRSIGPEGVFIGIAAASLLSGTVAYFLGRRLLALLTDREDVAVDPGDARPFGATG